MERNQPRPTIIGRLRDQGFVAYLAGGCVRDRILGVKAKDFDIATDARPEVVQICSPTRFRSALSSASWWW